ncbi:anhydro-N-acetylmuramic acid kinase [Jannaschia sp. LMIT008]|uniref:anhydro-N-acetylmuramic acid kinase n=1 Tax=Jannaschia maritima TaxID=3032585 RepID=UPI002811BD8B|nr:anhydro-N-acetylmuramic acid kinase [Jannaschia sp. LMIT008]
MATMRAIGTMSGTSLDGVDAATLETDGERIEAFGPGAFRPYTEAEAVILRAALGRWPGGAGVAAAGRVVEDAHAAILGEMIAADPAAALIGFHGQTLSHDPEGRRTHQCGDGAALASRLDRPVAWDFRTADVAAGGQGAPLAPLFHRACARWIGADAPVAFLNLGGVGNLTWIDSANDGDDGILAFDTGPANAPLDDLALTATGRPFDMDGALAAAGVPDDGAVEAVLAHPYFGAPAPKSLDRDAFAGVGAAIGSLPPADAAATWVAVLARSVTLGLALCPAPPRRVLVCGGGRRNPAIMAALERTLTVPVRPVEAVGLDGDLLEAQAFAFLAVRVLRGLPLSLPGTTGVLRPTPGGVVSQPSLASGGADAKRLAS